MPVGKFCRRIRLCILIQHDQKNRKPAKNIVCMHFTASQNSAGLLNAVAAETFMLWHLQPTKINIFYV